MLAAVHAEVSTLLGEAPKLAMSKSKLPGDYEALRGLPAVARYVKEQFAELSPSPRRSGA
jgi:hypothetical protein